MKEEDIRLYEDNCKIKECSCEWDAVVKCQECPRRMVVSDKVDGQWKKWKERKEDEERNLETMREESKTQFEIADVSSDLEDETEVLRKQEDEEMYEPNSRVQTAQNVSSISLRSSSITDDADDVNSDLSNPPFPQVPIRFGRHTFNPSVMHAVTHIQVTYKLSANDAMGVCVDLARMVFGQKWEKVADFDDGDNSCASDDDYETVEKVSDAVTSADKSSEADVQNQVTAKKRRRIQKDLTWRFPSRQTRRKWLRQGTLLNLRYVAEKIIKKQPEQVITLGFDDTTKAAGERLHDVKTTHITINSAEMDKETFTTGFTPNLSHSGIDQATTPRHKLQVLAVLAGDQTSVQDIIELIDFWMSDRSADGDVVLDNLGIDEKKVLKCSAHVILAIDEAIDAVFREVESKVGRDNLGSESMGAKAFQCKNSIITLGLIAIAKCLSPSHAALSYSLYQKYKDWRVTQGLPVSNFKGFVSNRFGRIAFIASLFLEHAEDLRRYWDSSIDENSNMLVLALSAYFHNDWFELGCKVYSVFDKVIITPLCELLGIDKYGEVKNGNRTWDGVQVFFNNKIGELKELAHRNKAVMAGKEKLVSSCAEKIVESLERHLSKMSFFRDDSEVDESTKAKMTYAPLTNSGCESRMAEFDVRVKSCGGSMPLRTISDMQNIAANKYLLTDDFDDPTKTSQLFKWARTSDEAKLANELENEFLEKVKLVRMQSAKAKELVKQRRIQRSLDLLHKCKQHGGPVTSHNISLLEELSEDKLITEVQYLKATVAGQVKIKKRVTDPATKKYRYQTLPIDTLKNSIRNIVKPNSKVEESVEELLLKTFIV